MNEVSTKDLISYLVSKKYLIATVTFLIAALSSVVALNLKEVYRSEALIQISDSNLSPNSSASSMSSGALGLASLAGLDLNSGNQSTSKNPAYVQAKITSRSFFDHLTSFPGILENVFADDYYDFGANKIVYDEEIYNSETNEWTRESAGLRQSKPSSLEAHRIFLLNLTISVDKKTGYIYLAYDHSSPFFAKEILDLIFKEVNSIQKEQDLIQTSNELNYLTELKSSNKLLYLEQSLSRLIVNLINEKMLASVTDQYLVEYIDEPFVPESRTFPRRTPIVLTVTILGFILTIFSMLFYNFVFIKNKNSSD